MSVHWRITETGNFEVVDRQEIVGKIFGSLMLFFAGCFLYWLGTALVELVRLGTWKEVLISIPGILISLFMAGLFGIPGCLMAFLKKKTVVYKAEGLIRQVKSFGVVRRAREIGFSDVRLVVARFRTTRSRRLSSGWSRGGAAVHVVELELAEPQQVEIAQLGKWDSTVELGQQLAGFLGVRFHEAPR